MNELIKQIQSQINPPRSNELKMRGPFRSQVIDAVLEKKKDRSRAVIGLTVDVQDS